MKKLSLFIITLFAIVSVKAQTPLNEAVDFNVKDIYGFNHQLFDILDNKDQYVLIDYFTPT